MEEQQPLTKAERRALKKEKKKMAQQGSQSPISRLTTYIVIGLIVLGLGWIWYSRSTPATEQAALPMDTVAESDWRLGNADAKVTFIEYSDFQCPACKAYRDLIEGLHEKYDDSQLAIVFRHFPLKTIHPQATLAAQAAEAAGKQGKFWEMHDLLFDNQADWAGKRNAEELFVTYAKSLELDEQQFLADISAGETKAAVENDYRSGVSNRINSTPTFFLDGERIGNPQSIEEFSQLIDEKLLAATESATTEE
jgi:protein-disulfide isomerase